MLLLLLIIISMQYFIILLDNENKNFSYYDLSNNFSKWDSDRKKYKASPKDKKVTPYVNVQLMSKSCLRFLNLSITLHWHFFKITKGHRTSFQSLQ